MVFSIKSSDAIDDLINLLMLRAESNSSPILSRENRSPILAKVGVFVSE